MINIINKHKPFKIFSINVKSNVKSTLHKITQNKKECKKEWL
jgi:hypothetical protein